MPFFYYPLIFVLFPTTAVCYGIALKNLREKMAAGKSGAFETLKWFPATYIFMWIGPIVYRVHFFRTGENILALCWIHHVFCVCQGGIYAIVYFVTYKGLRRNVVDLCTAWAAGQSGRGNGGKGAAGSSSSSSS